MMTDEERSYVEILAKLVELQGADNVVICRHPRNGVPSGQFALAILPKMLAQINEQASQIDSLKAACRHYCRNSIYLDHPDRSLESAAFAAEQKLARKYPDIFGESKP